MPAKDGLRFDRKSSRNLTIWDSYISCDYSAKSDVDYGKRGWYELLPPFPETPFPISLASFNAAIYRHRLGYCFGSSSSPKRKQKPHYFSNQLQSTIMLLTISPHNHPLTITLSQSSSAPWRRSRLLIFWFSTTPSTV